MVNGGADQETPRKLAGSIEIMFWFIQKLSEKKKGCLWPGEEMGRLLAIN